MASPGPPSCWLSQHARPRSKVGAAAYVFGLGHCSARSHAGGGRRAWETSASERSQVVCALQTLRRARMRGAIRSSGRDRCPEASGTGEVAAVDEKQPQKKRMRFWSCATCAPFFDEGSKQTTTIAADPPAQPMRPPALDQPDVAVVAFAEGPRARPSPWSMKGSQLCQKGAISFRTGRFSCWRDVSEEVVLQSRPRRRRSRRTRSTLRSAIEQGGLGGPDVGDASEGHRSSSVGDA